MKGIVHKVVSEVADSPYLTYATDVDMGNVLMVAKAYKKVVTFFSKIDSKILKEYFPRPVTTLRKAAQFSNHKSPPTPKVLAEVRLVRKNILNALKLIIKKNIQAQEKTGKVLPGFKVLRIRQAQSLVAELGNNEAYTDYVKYMKKTTKSGRPVPKKLKKSAPEPTPKKKTQKKTKKAVKTPKKPTVFRKAKMPKNTYNTVKALSNFVFNAIFLHDLSSPEVQNKITHRGKSIFEFIEDAFPSDVKYGASNKREIEAVRFKSAQLKKLEESVTILKALVNKLVAANDFKRSPSKYLASMKKVMPLINKRSIKGLLTYYKGLEVQKTARVKEWVGSVKTLWKRLKPPEGFTKSFVKEKQKQWGGTKVDTFEGRLVSDTVKLTFRFGSGPNSKGGIEWSGTTEYKSKDGWYSFDRRGITDSFYGGDTEYPDLLPVVEEEVERAKNRISVVDGMIPVPEIGYKITKDRKATIIETLKKGKPVTFTPSGMGTGLYLTVKPMYSGPSGSRVASKELAKFFGFPALYLTEFDYD